MDSIRQLAHQGFKRAATLDWRDTPDDIQFDFIGWTPHGDTEPVIYAYVDIAGSRLLNIGQTSGSFRQRSGGYKAWINGKDKNRNAPVNGRWLNCLLGECAPSKVEVWVKQSFPDVGNREAEESRLIRELHPILNTRP